MPLFINGYFVEIISVLCLQNGTSLRTTSNAIAVEYGMKNTTLNNFERSLVNKTHDLNNYSRLTAVNATDKQKVEVTKRVKKRRKIRKNRIQHKGSTTLFVHITGGKNFT